MSDAVAAEVAPALPPASGGPRLGAIAPRAGGVVLTLGAGGAIVVPHLTAEARVGLGRSTSVELRYRNLGIFGHFVQGRFTWATPVTRSFTFGLAARTSVGTLSPGDGGSFGIEFSTLSLGNDWEVGHDFLLTWSRPGQAHITGAIGPSYALGGPRYTSYDERDWRWDARWQSVTASLLGEWELTMKQRFFLKLDALFLIKADIVPYGFLPTFTIGHAWST